MKKTIIALLIGVLLIFSMVGNVSAIQKIDRQKEQSVQNIKFEQGWNHVSFYVLPKDNSIEDVFGNELSKISTIKTVINGEKLMWGSEINPLFEINYEYSYDVYVRESFVLKIQGYKVETPFSINLYKLEDQPYETSFNYIGFPFNWNANVEEIFSEIEGKINIIKDDKTGEFYIPGVINTIGNLKPGHGYKISVNEDVVFTFPIVNVVPMIQKIDIHKIIKPINMKRQVIPRDKVVTSLVIEKPIFVEKPEPTTDDNQVILNKPVITEPEGYLEETDSNQVINKKCDYIPKWLDDSWN